MTRSQSQLMLIRTTLKVALTVLIVSAFACPQKEERPVWIHLSSATGDLPVPSAGKQQTGSLILDIDQDGTNDFVITERTASPSVVWYRRGADGWTRYVVENDALRIEAGGAFHDIDGDGDPDVLFGEDSRGNKIYWWENPYPDFKENVSWTRREIKNTGANKHHDQIFGDFDGDGEAELVFWNQGALKLFMAEIPSHPKATEPWHFTEIFSSESESEGLAAADIDGDGKTDIVGGGRWFKHEGGTQYTPHIIDDSQRFTRAAAGQLIAGGRPEAVFVVGDGVGRLKWYEWTTNTSSWLGHDLLGIDVVHGHSLAVADIDGDGNLDIFCAEMGKWSNNATVPDNPEARMRVFLGDGAGNFTPKVIAGGFGNHESKPADLDGDGDIDILGKPYNWETPRLDIWLNSPADH